MIIFITTSLSNWFAMLSRSHLRLRHIQVQSLIYTNFVLSPFNTSFPGLTKSYSDILKMLLLMIFAINKNSYVGIKNKTKQISETSKLFGTRFSVHPNTNLI